MFASVFMGHLVGDYLLQNDWLAKNKKTSSFACFLHCWIYTLTVGIFAWGSLGTYSLCIILATHFLIDRGVWLKTVLRVTGKKAFLEPPMFPWSYIIVDNILHLLVLYFLVLSV